MSVRARREARKFAAIGLAVVFLAVFFAYSESLYREWEREQNLSSIRSEIADKTAEKRALEDLVAYLETREYEELQAKSLLGKKLPGEEVFAFDEKNFGKSGAEPGAASIARGNLEAWWRYFFGQKAPLAPSPQPATKILFE